LYSIGPLEEEEKEQLGSKETVQEEAPEEERKKSMQEALDRIRNKATGDKGGSGTSREPGEEG